MAGSSASAAATAVSIAVRHRIPSAVAECRISAASEADGEVPILDLIASGEVRLVVNTPTPRSGAVRDAVEIRHAATAEGILCLTAIETAVAAAEALDPSIAERLAEVRSLDEWVPREQRALTEVTAVTA